MIKPLLRPNKFYDAAALESWANNFYVDVFDEWECGAAEWLDFWDWLEREHPEVLDEFVDYYRGQDSAGIP